MSGEFALIDWIRSQQRASALVQLPACDDLAILRWTPGDLLLVGSDQVLDGVHFDSAVHSPELIGRKGMNRNLSDCAAMAALPAAAVVTVALPKRAGIEYAKSLYLGMKSAADCFGCELVGGDTATWDGKLAVSVTILGRSDGIAPIQRAGATPGDSIFVTGPLGGSIRGRHMTFEPRIQLARELASKFKISAMIDLSDGLSRDLAHICRESQVGAIVDIHSIPIHADAEAPVADSNEEKPRSSWRRAIDDGEDYELLFTSRACDHPQVTQIGTISAEKTIVMLKDGVTIPLSPKGWEHQL